MTTCFGLYRDSFYELQCVASSSSTIYLWPDDGLVIKAETCCHLVTLNKINIRNTSCVLTCESLLLILQILLQPRFIFYPWAGSNFTTSVSTGYCMGSYRRFRSSYLTNCTKLRGVQRQISVILIFIILRTSYRVPQSHFTSEALYLLKYDLLYTEIYWPLEMLKVSFFFLPRYILCIRNVCKYSVTRLLSLSVLLD